jgi:hypothetical protein
VASAASTSEESPTPTAQDGDGQAIADPAETAQEDAPAAASTMATVTIRGDARSVWLQSAAGNFRAGEVPPGTYKIKVFFEGMDPRNVGEIQLVAGQKATLAVCKQEP